MVGYELVAHDFCCWWREWRWAHSPLCFPWLPPFPKTTCFGWKTHQPKPVIATMPSRDGQQHAKPPVLPRNPCSRWWPHVVTAGTSPKATDREHFDAMIDNMSWNWSLGNAVGLANLFDLLILDTWLPQDKTMDKQLIYLYDFICIMTW